MAQRRLPESSGIRGRAALRIAAFVAAAASSFSAGVWASEPTPQPTIAPSAALQMQALVAIKMAKTSAEAKIDSRLYLGVLHQRNDPRLAPLTDFRFVTPEGDNRIPVDVVLASAGGVTPVMEKLQSVGGVIRAKSYTYHRVSARIHLDDLEALAAMPEVRKVRQAIPARTHAINTSQGDLTHGAKEAREFFGVTGTGVKVGVISNGVDSLASLQASGDLPAVQVLTGQAGAGDEGSAMLEIVHDLAPGAALAFATGDPDEATFAQNILALAAAGCNIIVDDISYLRESPFEDGPEAQAVNTVTAAGVLYFSSAGNEGNKTDATSGTWEGDFVGNGTLVNLGAGPAHNFGDGGQSILVEAGGGNPPVLIWAEHYDLATGNASTDFDLYDMDGGLTTILDASTDGQDGVGGDDFPVEIISGGTFDGERLVVVMFSPGTTTSVPMFNLIVFGGRLDHNLATSGATRGHSSAAGALSVAATPAAASFDGMTPAGPFPGLFTTANASESFTSDGPRRIILGPTGAELTPNNRTTTGGVVRQKPDITAADGVATAAPGFNPFYGTSAAAPHAAAIAALLKSAVPGLTPAQARTALISSAIDIEAPGVDRDTGSGIVMAHSALQGGGASPHAFLAAGAVVPTELIGDGDAYVESNEIWKLTVPLNNAGGANATGISAVLTSSTPGISIATGSSAYPNLVPGASGNNATPFIFRVAGTVPCGSLIQFVLTASYAGGASGGSPQAFTFSITTGSAGTPAVCDAPPLTTVVTGTMSVNGAFHVGGTVTYTVTLTNNSGLSQADNPGHELTDDLPSSLTLVGASASSGTAVANVGTGAVTWDGSLAALGGAVTITITARINAVPGGTTVSNQGAIHYDADANGTSETTTTTDDPAVGGAHDPTSFVVVGGVVETATKTVAGTFSAGGTVTYTVTITNSGNVPATDNPGNEFVDVLPSGLTLVGASASTGTALATIGTNTVTWNGGTTANGSVTIIIRATVNPGTVGTTITNQGTISYDADGNGVNETTTTTDDPALGGAHDPTSFVVQGGRYFTVAPCRVLDTRSGAPIPAGGTLTVTLTAGGCGIPSTASAVAVNATVTQEQAAGHITLYSADQPLPNTSVLNFGAGQTRGNNAIVSLPIDGSGAIKALNGSDGASHLVIDVNGYFE